MKRVMRRLAGGLLLICMMMALSACGEKQQNATLTLNQDGMKTKMVVEAKGDKITKITQTTSISKADFEKDVIDAILANVDATKEQYSKISGTEYALDQTDAELKETIAFSISDDNIKELTESGVLPIDGDSSEIKYLSFDKTKESLESAGWTVE